MFCFRKILGFHGGEDIFMVL